MAVWWIFPRRSSSIRIWLDLVILLNYVFIDNEMLVVNKTELLKDVDKR